MEPRICVIFTGGTIGSKVNQDIIDLNATASYTLIESSKYNYLPFETMNPLYILSENIIISDWMTIGESINEAMCKNYDGIVVTHGTDTLPYTAAAISYMFRHTQIPIVFVSSQFPLDNPLSNGIENFDLAISFILNTKLPGIFVSWCDDGVKCIHLATRITEATPFDCKFNSILNTPFGFMDNDKFIWNDKPHNPTQNDMHIIKDHFTESFCFSNDIMLIKPYPGINYEMFGWTGRKPKAILHALYHSGTACTREHANSAADFLVKCIKEGIDCYIAPIPSTNEDLYSSSNILLKTGAIPMTNMSLEAALVKLFFAYGSFPCPKEILDINIFYENF